MRLLVVVLLAASVLRAQVMPVEGRRGMVASAHVLASEAGAEVLRAGGNAVDAAVATGLALAVVLPRAGNLGGGGFLLLRLPDGRAEVIDFRETAPAAATRDMYVGPDGKLVPGASTLGLRASGVPGTVAGFALARERHGRLAWERLVAPAARLAEGFPATTGLVRDLRRYEKELSRFPETRRVYLRDGRLPEVGERYEQPDLAATLKRLADEGPREFYTGLTARRIVEHMREGGGLITAEDLAGYRAVVREPLRATYRGHEILTMPPPSSGGIALLQMLAMQEVREGWKLPAGSAPRLHLLAECMRRAFRDRAEYLGDPDFVQVPVPALLDPAYTKQRIENFDTMRATPSPEVKPGLGAREPAPARREHDETTHYSVVDADGLAVSVTYTLNGLFGSTVTVPGTGVLLNNEMDDFAALPGTPNLFGLIQGDANAIAPGKRPLSSMTPTIVSREGVPVLVTGSPGGPTIINTVLQVVLNLTDLGMNLQQAVSAPRIHHQWMPDRIDYESFGLAPETLEALASRGHAVALRSIPGYDPVETGSRVIGLAESVGVDPVTRRSLGAADPRGRDGAAVPE